MSELFDLTVRLSFPGLTRPLEATGEAMAVWTRAAAKVLAPELTWRTESEEREHLDDDGRWGARFLLELAGTRPDGARHGRARMRLAVGGDKARAGASSSIEIETIAPARHLHADNHCDVTHWDVRASPVTADDIDALRLALEGLLERHAEAGGERRERIERGAQLLGRTDAEEAALWIDDLRSVGIEARGHTSAGGVSVLVERACIDDIATLDEARVVLGEVLSEAGHEDWYERARHLLVRLPAHSR